LSGEFLVHGASQGRVKKSGRDGDNANAITGQVAGQGAHRLCALAVAGQGGVDDAAAASRVRADDLQVASAAVPTPRGAVGGGEDAPDLRRLLDALPAGTLAIDLNPGGLVANALSPQEVVRAVGSDIRHVWANDSVRDLARGRGLAVELGRGSVDYPALLGALEECRYQGNFTIVRDDSGNPVEEFGHAVQFLHNVNV